MKDKHIEEGLLRAFLDDVHPAVEDQRIKDHLAACRACRESCEHLANQSGRVGSRLDVLSPGQLEEPVAISDARRRFESQYIYKESNRC